MCRFASSTAPASAQLLPYTAACPSSFPYQCLTRVVLGDGHLFAALWEGKGGSQAARHCVSTCYDEVLSCIRAGDDPSTALSKACQHMDEAYLNSPDLPDLVRPGVYTAVVVCIFVFVKNVPL